MLIQNTRLLCISLFVLCKIALSHQDNDVQNVGIRTVGGQNVADAFNRMIGELNAPVDPHWGNYMNGLRAHGSMNAKLVTLDNYQEFVNSWAIINEMKESVNEVVKILVLSADASFKAERLHISRQGYLATVVVVARANPDNSHEVTLGYLMMESTCNVIQQQTAIHYQECKRCGKKLWLGKCCSNKVRYEPRGLTPAEVLLIANRLREEQYNYARSLPHTNAYNELSRFDEESSDTAIVVKSSTANSWNKMHKSMVKFTRDVDIQEEIIRSDNSSFIKDLQSKIKTLDKTYQVISLKKVNSKNLKTVLTYLSSKYNFNFNYTAEVEKKLETDNFVLEKFLSEKNELSYTMIVTVKTEDNYDITATHSKTHFEEAPPLNLTIFSTAKDDKFADTEEVTDNSKEKLGAKVLKILILTFRWFSVQKILSGISPVLEPIFMPLAVQELNLNALNSEIESPYFVQGLVALGGALEAVAKGWQSIVSIFKSKTSVQLQHIVRLGFNHFSLDSSVLMLKGFPNDKVDTLADYIFKKFDVPDSMKVNRDDIIILGLAEDGSVWDQTRTLFSKDSKGSCNHLQILKNPNPDSVKANWIVSSFKTDLLIAPDILVKTTSKSRFGGLFESEKTEFLQTPHVLTMDEILQITKFIEIVAYGRVASEVGIKLNWPNLN